MTEISQTLGRAANVFDLQFFGGYGDPFISYDPPYGLKEQIERENLEDAFRNMAVGFCNICPLNPKSPKYKETKIASEKVYCKTLKPCCGATEETFYTSGSADIKAPFKAFGTTADIILLSKTLEPLAKCLNNNIRTQPHIPLSQR